ncbi:MAG: zinc-ribbon domain-containing protein [Bacteroidetes bacterium]|nr:zinc-ribbon domain-containing protein [Fibrella sp.]
MVIYGMRSSHLESFDARTTCTSCGQRDKTVVSIFGRYAHIFWIPLFPIGKTAVTYCEHCKASFENKDFAPDLKADIKTMKVGTKAPVWHYSGLGLLTVLAGYGFYADGQTKETNARYLADPKPGDKYEYRIQEDGKSTYTLFKVAAVGKDTIWAYENQYTMDKKTRIDKIDIAENYATNPTPIPRSAIAKMQQQDDIVEISR